MTQSDILRREIYGTRPHSEVDRDRMKRWNKLETECDEHNANQMLAMDISHLNKTKAKSIASSIKRWMTANKRQAKLLTDYKKLPNSNIAIERVWII